MRPPLTLPPALPAERFSVEGVSAYVAGEGPPLLLVHSVNAAASAAEVRPLFDHYRTTRTVFAIDLPGYGHSERSARRYTPRLMTNALHVMTAQIRQRCGATPVDAIGVSLGCEFVARAAVEQPARWGRLALVSPTGLSGRKRLRGPVGSTRAVPGLHAVLACPLWAQLLFRALTRPAVIRYFLQRTWGSERIDEALWAYDVLTARRRGARHAPLYFLSAGLFSADMHTLYEQLRQPLWLSRGVRGDFVDYRALLLVAGHERWRYSVFDGGALPYFEHPAAFCAACDAFFDGAGAASMPAVPPAVFASRRVEASALGMPIADGIAEGSAR